MGQAKEELEILVLAALGLDVEEDLLELPEEIRCLLMEGGEGAREDLR
jgi:hypothetical protein